MKMTEKYIRINGFNQITELVRITARVDGDVTFRKGKYCVDGKSVMGVLSLDLSTGVTIEYPFDAKELEEYIAPFCC